MQQQPNLVLKLKCIVYENCYGKKRKGIITQGGETI